MSVEVGSRQRLRPWLEAKINGGQIQGLEWINREQQIFKVPWKHGGKHDWNEHDSQIFKEWAMHTGRFREGVDDPDWPTWKTRFRCALNKLPDIQEVKDLSKLDGTDPFRAYKFIPRKGMAQRNGHVSGQQNYHQHFTHPALPDILNNVPSNDSRLINGHLQNLPSDLTDIDVSQFVGSMKTEPPEDMDTSMPDQIGFNGNLNMIRNQTCQRSTEKTLPILRTTINGAPRFPVSPTKQTQPEIHEMRVSLRYRHMEVAEHVVKNPLGCRLFYGPRINEMDNQFSREIYGPEGVESLHFPLLTMIDNPKQEELTIKLLDVLDRGLVLENENGDIYATRKCRCVIFVGLPHCSGDPVKLIRDERVKIFDYRRYFEGMLQRYLSGRGPRPSADVLIGFGQKWLNNSSIPYNNILISATIYHCMAQYRLDQIMCSSPLSPPIEQSKSDDFDKFLDQYKRVEAARTNGFHIPATSDDSLCA